jgi:uncharacterized membrane protein YfcA
MGLNEVGLLALLGIIAGLLSGALGIGGGIISIPGLIYLLGVSQQMAQGTSLAFMIPPIGLIAALNYYKAGYVNIKYAIIIAIFFVIGSYFSSNLVVKLDPKMLRRVFALLLVVVAGKMFFQK